MEIPKDFIKNQDISNEDVIKDEIIKQLQM